MWKPDSIFLFKYKNMVTQSTKLLPALFYYQDLTGAVATNIINNNTSSGNKSQKVNRRISVENCFITSHFHLQKIKINEH